MFYSIWSTQIIYYLFISLVLKHMVKVSMTSFDSVGAAALMSLMFAICHMFSRRRHSQNRRVENAPFIESFMVKLLLRNYQLLVLKATQSS